MGNDGLWRVPAGLRGVNRGGEEGTRQQREKGCGKGEG